jgi:ankyrin repeat protein
MKREKHLALKPYVLALHRLIGQGDVDKLARWLRETRRALGEGGLSDLLNKPYAPLNTELALTAAAGQPRTTPALLACLQDFGAELDSVISHGDRPARTPLDVALGAGRLDLAQWLVTAGADLRYVRDGFTALLDAVHNHDVLHDDQLLDTVQWLIDQGVDLNSVSPYAESGLRVLSRIGRFDAILLLLYAGADDGQLEFSPLHTAVAFGDAPFLRDALLKYPDQLEARDFWSRTPLLLAAVVGDVEKLELLRAHGADVQAVGRCGIPLLHYAVDGGHSAMLSHLLSLGIDAEQTNDFGYTPLTHAAAIGAEAAVEVLLAAGANVHAATSTGQRALNYATHAGIAQKLLDAGAFSRDLSMEGCRAILGFSPEPDPLLLDCTENEFEVGRVRRFGARNGDDMTSPYMLAMIRSGVNAYGAMQQLCNDPNKYRRFGEGAIPPVWCAHRFGQSLTLLPDGRIVQIGGEHEDYYDPDFCIYNDVFVHHPDGAIRVYGYPEAVFPSTDFHTATLMEFGGDPSIFVIGNLGYIKQRQPGHTPVYRLRIRDWTMHAVRTHGTSPGWIYQHGARRLSPDEIEVSGGKVWTGQEDGGSLDNLERRYVLNVRSGQWRQMSEAEAQPID